MKLVLPAVYGVDNIQRCGTVRQILKPSTPLAGETILYAVNRHKGRQFTPTDGSGAVHLFPKPPEESDFGEGAKVLVDCSLQGESIDLSRAHWFRHPLLTIGPQNARTRAIESWAGAFRYVSEQTSDGRIALRTPQAGALHAIHAHWSTSNETATVVMPTGTGKTETMLAAVVSATCDRVLVLVPTDALRTQIAEKFLTLGVLKRPGNAVLAEQALRPVVGTLVKKPKTPEEVDDFFDRCNVVVTTSQLAGGCTVDVQNRMAAKCSHLFIDEAHHAEARTWRDFKACFTGSRVLQFTATPFRDDGQLIDGKIIYVYPLRKAQQEGYFKPIKFSAVYEFDVSRADTAIARKALEELDADTTGRHVVMARVASIHRAEAVFSIYKELGRYNPVMLHTGVNAKVRQQATNALTSGESRIVVCVDMLGEGFDMPELKIAAFHDVRKSLAVTLQLAGRFTRSREDLGDPIFIANTATLDLQEELRRLYSQDPDWNSLLPELSDAAIADEVGAQEYMRGFATALEAVPLKDLRPAASTVIYRTACSNWNPKAFRKALRGFTPRNKLHLTLNERENTLVALTASERGVPWTDAATVYEWAWELFILVWDRQNALLFIHGSSNSGEYRDFAKAVCGDDVALIVDPEVYRTFHGINRLLLTNVGLDEHFGRQIRYTGRMGADVGSRLSDATRQSVRKAVLAGIGYENGAQASIGAAKRGRVWSNQRLRVDTFTQWCRHLATKIVDNTIDPNEVLKGTLVPKMLAARPETVAIGVDWPCEILERPENMIRFKPPGGDEIAITEVDLSVVDGPLDKPVVLRVNCADWSRDVRVVLFPCGQTTDFRFEYVSAERLIVRKGASPGIDLCEYLTSNPPTVWFADGSSLEGNLYTELPTSAPQYDTEKLEVLDWTGVDLTKESQGEERRRDSIQFRLISKLKANGGYTVLFDDDGSGEAADVVGIRVEEGATPKRIHVEFYHCKYSKQAPGNRIDDLYVVCGQAQKSLMWLYNKEKRTDLFAHLLKREAKRVDRGATTRFEVGDKSALAEIREMSRRFEIRLSVWVVQPGISKSAIGEAPRVLLGVTERYLFETYQVPLKVICST